MLFFTHIRLVACVLAGVHQMEKTVAPKHAVCVCLCVHDIKSGYQ